jgi:hypothetical protein
MREQKNKESRSAEGGAEMTGKRSAEETNHPTLSPSELLLFVKKQTLNRQESQERNSQILNPATNAKRIHSPG